MKSLLQKMVLLGASMIVAGGLLEAGVLLALGQQHKAPRHVVASDFGLRINEPNAVYRHKSADMTAWFRINSKGLRADREFSYEKPDGVKRIVSLGDSFTVGHEANVEETFSSMLEATLRARGHEVEVLNSGVSGFGTAEECLYLERELIKYNPDVVVITFFGNDLVDSVRSNLFALDEGRLVQINDSYIPLGRFGDFLNRNRLVNFASERSNAFALIKERTTELLKRKVVADNVKNLQLSERKAADKDQRTAYERQLTAAIFDRVYGFTHVRGIPLVIQSIPYRLAKPARLLDVFPTEYLDINRPDLYFLSATSFLEPWLEKRLLYWERSDGHWTPYANELSGLALADLILSRDLLRERSDGSQRLSHR